MRCTGSRLSRREIQSSYNTACSSASGASQAANSARPTPISSERRTSADAAASGTPARSSLAAASRDACRAPIAPVRIGGLTGGSGGLSGELVGPLLGSQCLGELFKVAAQGCLEVVGGHADAVVGYAPLREIVGAHLRRAVAGADLGLAEGTLLLRSEERRVGKECRS